MPERARRRRRIDTGGPWGTGLLILSVAFFMLGVGYITRPDRQVPDALAALTIPRMVWGSLWLAAGLYGAWKALTPPQHHRQVWPFAGLTSLWAGAYFVHWLLNGIRFNNWLDPSWQSGFLWAAFAGVILTWGGRLVNPAPTNSES